MLGRRRKRRGDGCDDAVETRLLFGCLELAFAASELQPLPSDIVVVRKWLGLLDLHDLMAAPKAL